MKNKLLLAVFVLFIIIAKNSIFIVEQSQQAIILQLGEVVSTKPIQAGLHFKLPFIQTIVQFDKRVLNLNSDSREIIAADQKRLIVNYYVKYLITDPVTFYKSVRNEITLGNRLGPIVESQVREQIGFVSLISLLKEARSSVMTSIKEKVNNQVTDLGIKVVDVRIKKTDLPEENSEAIFRRMQTEREKEAKEIRAKGVEEAKIIMARADKEARIIIAKSEKKAKILKGEGDAKATKIFNDAFGIDENFFNFYRHMQAYRKSMAQGNTKLVISSDNPFLNYFKNMEGH
ncbi:MAG: protease modulator HflC [Rickettsiaceae bacterium H1]|nr:protease modulator HflC [Rickettsiaceae bacterium H1]